MHLDHWFYASNQAPSAMIQISNFGEDEIVSMFYAWGLYVLCMVPMLIIHPHSVNHDVGGGNHVCVRWNVHLVERFLRGNKINFIHSTTNFYAMSWPKTFVRILTIVSMHPIGHHLPWNFKFFRRWDRLHVLRLRSPCFMQCSYVNYTPHSGKHDNGGSNHGCVWWNVHLVERLLCGNKIIFYLSHY